MIDMVSRTCLGNTVILSRLLISTILKLHFLVTDFHPSLHDLMLGVIHTAAVKFKGEILDFMRLVKFPARQLGILIG